MQRNGRAQKRARDKSPPPAGVQPLPPTLVVQLQPSVGDFVKEVHTALRRQQGSKGSCTLWVYNDNEQDRHSAIAGEGDTKIRPYNTRLECTATAARGRCDDGHERVWLHSSHTRYAGGHRLRCIPAITRLCATLQ